MTSDVLRRNKDNPDFKLVLLTCSITYLHREAFRSDVLVSFNPPIELTIKDHYALFSTPRPLPGSDGTLPGIEGTPSASASNAAIALNSPQQPPVLDGVKQLTQLMYEQIRQSTLDSPDFETVRIANTARRLYAPLGTQITLGDHVHITQRFVDVFARRAKTVDLSSARPAEVLMTPLPMSMQVPSTPARVTQGSTNSKDVSVTEGNSTAVNGAYFGVSRRINGDKEEPKVTDEEIEQLKRDLHVSASTTY